MAHPTYNMITNTHICQASGDEFMNIHASKDTTSPQVETINDFRKFLCILVPRLEIQDVYQSKTGFPFPNSIILVICHCRSSHKWAPTTLQSFWNCWNSERHSNDNIYRDNNVLLCKLRAVSFGEIMSFVTRYLTDNVQILPTTGVPSGLVSISTSYAYCHNILLASIRQGECVIVTFHNGVNCCYWEYMWSS